MCHGTPRLDVGVGPATRGKATMSTIYNSHACERRVANYPRTMWGPNRVNALLVPFGSGVAFQVWISCCVELTNDVIMDMLPWVAKEATFNLP